MPVSYADNNTKFRCLVGSGNCHDTSNVATLTVNNNVDIQESLMQKPFSVYPNPANDMITLTIDSNKGNYSISDNTGRVVLSGELSQHDTQIDIHQLSPGMYTVTFGRKKSHTLKFVKE
ncbi:MAG: T9SS type A sorting domain-containing protein [Bacteroidota bacterium]